MVRKVSGDVPELVAEIMLKIQHIENNFKYSELKRVNFVSTFQETKRSIRAEVHTHTAEIALLGSGWPTPPPSGQIDIPPTIQTHTDTLFPSFSRTHTTPAAPLFL